MGYYFEHTPQEKLCYEEWRHTYEVLAAMLEKKQSRCLYACLYLYDVLIDCVLFQRCFHVVWTSANIHLRQTQPQVLEYSDFYPLRKGVPLGIYDPVFPRSCFAVEGDLPLVLVTVVRLHGCVL